jgi:hypothetical protein
MDGAGIEDIEAERRALAVDRAARLQAREDLHDALFETLRRGAAADAQVVLEVCDGVMGLLRDKLPEPMFTGSSPYFTGQRSECELWAEFASDGQIAAMLAACMDRIGGTRLLIEDRKRLLVAVWNSLTPEDRKAFRDRVMPKDNAR